MRVFLYGQFFRAGKHVSEGAQVSKVRGIGRRISVFFAGILKPALAISEETGWKMYASL